MSIYMCITVEDYKNTQEPVGLYGRTPECLQNKKQKNKNRRLEQKMYTVLSLKILLTAGLFVIFALGIKS